MGSGLLGTWTSTTGIPTGASAEIPMFPGTGGRGLRATLPEEAVVLLGMEPREGGGPSGGPELFLPSGMLAIVTTGEE